MANTKLRNIQFYRNGQVQTIAVPETGVDLKSAYKQAEQDFIATGKHNNMLDGEFLLYRFSYDGQVHTLVGVVHAEGTETTSKRSLEVLANYDMLGGEISDAINAALAELDATVNDSNEKGDISVKVTQENGKLTAVEVTDSLKNVAHTGAAADVTIEDAGELIEATTVEGALTELATAIDALEKIDPVVTTVSGGTGISVQRLTTPSEGSENSNDIVFNVGVNFTVDTKKYPTESTAEGYDADKAGKTYIRIMDGETIISETDAAAFVKDGFLQSVEKDADNNTLKFTWNTDAGVQETTISIKELCDVYKVGAGLVASADGYTFSHQTGATGLTAGTAFGSGSATTNKITVKVPSVTVDAFGHVSALTENEVSLEIPASVATAVQTVTGDTYVSATKTNDTTVKLTTVTGAVADGEDKLATAQSVKAYVDGKIGEVNTAIENLDAEVTSADGTNVQVKVTEVDGKITAVNVTTDNTINATDLSNAIKALDTPEGGVSSADTNNVKVTVTQVDGIVNTVTVVDNSVNANEVNTAITTAIAGLESDAENATGDIKVKVSQANGELTSVVVTDTLAEVAHTGAAANVSIADGSNLFTAENVEGALAEVMTKANELDAAQLSAGKGIDIVTSTVDGVRTNSINADLELSIANETTGEGESAVTKTYLYIKDGEGNEISKLDASEFVKDGFLKSVVLDDENGELVFTWNTDAEGAGEQNQVTRIAISDLCDVYTAKENDWILLNEFEFSHKTQDAFTQREGQDTPQTTFGANATDVTVNNTNSQSFKVPTLTVDAAGHVTAASEKTVTISLPTSIDTAIQGGAGVDTTYIKTTVARNATNTNQLDVTSTAQIGNYAAEGQVDGLATTTATKTYVDTNMTKVMPGNGINIIGIGKNEYSVNLNGVVADVTEDADNYADATGTHTRISDITVDQYGRVTAVTKTTVTEFFDAGTY